MAERLQVVRRSLYYPATAEMRRVVREAGGFSKLTPDQRATVRFTHVQPGEFCDDMPPESIEGRLASGDIVRVSLDAPPARKAEA